MAQLSPPQPSWTPQRADRRDRFEDVATPSPNQGVGDALRAAYVVPDAGRDLEMLLRRLG